MARVSLILGVLCSIFIAVLANQQINHIAGRSGDVIIQSNKEVADASKLYFYYNEASSKISNRILKDVEIADFVSFAIGGPNLQSSNRGDFPQLLPFNKAHANLMFVAPGVSEETFSIRDIKMVARKDLVAKYPVQSSSYPQDIVSQMTTIATGQSPSTHQIVGRSWNTAHFGKTAAFKANALPKVESLAAKHAGHYEGQTLAISGCSDFGLAASVGFYPFDLQNITHLAYYYNSDTAQVENIYDGSVLFTKDDLMDRVAARQYRFKDGDTTRWLTNRKEIIINIKNTRDILQDRFNGEADIKSVYNLNDKTVLGMFADFEIAFAVVEQLKTNPALQAAVKDHVHDLFTFVFPGIRAVTDKFGPLASQRLSTLYLLDAVTTEVMEEISALYDGKIATELLLLDMPAATVLNLDNNLKESTFASVKQFVGTQTFGEYFPSIYAKDEASVQPLCQALKQHLGTSFQVHCFNRDAQVFARLKEDFERAVTLSSNDVAIFQIVLWFSIILFISLVVVVYSIFNMDTKMEALLMKSGPQGALKPHSN